MKTWLFLAVFSLGTLFTLANAATIDFEGTGAPGSFADTTALTNELAAGGVIFSGPGGNDGGAILNESASLGIGARSGTDFLAFNSPATLMDGGIPQGPETILFSSLVSSVSIWANGGFFDGLFRLEAFDASNVSIGSAQVATSLNWELLTFSGSNIMSVQLTELSGIQAYVYDDLSFEPVQLTNVPEPGTLVLLVAGLLGLLGLWRSKERAFAHLDVRKSRAWNQHLAG